MKFDVVDTLKKNLMDEYKDVNTLDGIRVNLENAWVLIRPSNTSPIIRLTAEADNEEILNQVTEQFKKRTDEIIENMKKKSYV